MAGVGLDQFWQERFVKGRESVRRDKVLQLLVVNRLIEPGSEFHLHRHWFLSSAMDELLNTDLVIADEDRLYRCLDRFENCDYLPALPILKDSL